MLQLSFKYYSVVTNGNKNTHKRNCPFKDPSACAGHRAHVIYRAGQRGDSFTLPQKIILHKSLRMSLSVNVIALIPHTAAKNNKQQDKIAHKASTDACDFLILSAVCKEKEQLDREINECYAFSGIQVELANFQNNKGA